MGLYHRHKENSPFAPFPSSRQSRYIEILEIKVYSVERQLGLLSKDQAESGSEKPAFSVEKLFEAVIGICNLESGCFKGRWISIMIIGHCGGWHESVLVPKKKNSAAICESQHWFFPYAPPSLPYVTLCLCSFERWDLLLRPRALLFLKVPPPPASCRKYIISGDKHRKQDVLSCCEAIFLPLSFHHKSRLCQPLLLNNYVSYWTAPEKQRAGSQLSIFTPWSQKTTSSNLFFP